MKRRWSQSENKISSWYYIETFIVNQRKISLSDAAEELQRRIPRRDIGTLRMKLQNCRAISCQMGLTVDTAPFKGLHHPSAYHLTAFQTLLKLNVPNVP